MKYLILGACGMAGHITAAYLSQQGHDVTGLARRPSPVCKTVVADAADFARLDQILADGEYDYVINCIGVLNQFAEADPENAVRMNALLPHHLAAATKTLPTRVVQISTDCVFSGKNPPYKTDSLRDGETFYDRTKALGELDDARNITLRGSIVGPDINPNGIGLLNWFMQQNGKVNGFRKAIWTGQTTLQLAKTIETVTREGAAGLYNTVPDSSISKYALLGLFNRYLRAQPIEIAPQDAFVCDKTLVQSEAAFCRAIPDYETMIRELADWMREHKRLYAHYAL